MYLSDRDIRWAIQNGDLILPADAQIDPTSVDLCLDAISEAKVWDVDKLSEEMSTHGVKAPELRLGSFKYVNFADKYLRDISEDAKELVFRRGDEIIVKPGGFLLWQTSETVGTPDQRADLICFVNGKSTRARTGILVHFTAPTIHSGWSGKVVLEITNLGPFHFVLKAGDVIAQLTVARITSCPEKSHQAAASSTYQQVSPGGSKGPKLLGG